MLEALAEAALEAARKKFRRKGRKQGEAREGWIVVDYGDVVVHLFSSEQRDYYNLEELWGDGKVLLRVQ